MYENHFLDWENVFVPFSRPEITTAAQIIDECFLI